MWRRIKATRARDPPEDNGPGEICAPLMLLDRRRIDCGGVDQQHRLRGYKFIFAPEREGPLDGRYSLADGLKGESVLQALRPGRRQSLNRSTPRGGSTGGFVGSDCRRLRLLAGLPTSRPRVASRHHVPDHSQPSATRHAAPWRLSATPGRNGARRRLIVRVVLACFHLPA